MGLARINEVVQREEPVNYAAGKQVLWAGALVVGVHRGNLLKTNRVTTKRSRVQNLTHV